MIGGRDHSRRPRRRRPREGGTDHPAASATPRRVTVASLAAAARFLERVPSSEWIIQQRRSSGPITSGGRSRATAARTIAAPIQPYASHEGSPICQRKRTRSPLYPRGAVGGGRRRRCGAYTGRARVVVRPYRVASEKTAARRVRVERVLLSDRVASRVRRRRRGAYGSSRAYCPTVSRRE